MSTWWNPVLAVVALATPALACDGAKKETTAAGAATTLEVRVNDLLWRETDAVALAGPDARVVLRGQGRRLRHRGVHG